MTEHKFTSIYIGATHDINERFTNYTEWKFRCALYSTSSKNIANKAEEILIKFVKQNFSIACNILDKSVGLKPNKAQYYIYMIADNSCQKR